MFRTRAYLTNLCLVSFDLGLAACCCMALQLRAAGLPGTPAGSESIAACGFMVAVWVVLCAYFGMYHSRRLDSPFSDAAILFQAGAAAWVVVEGAAHVAPALAPDGSFLLRFSALNFLVLTVARSVLRLGTRELRRRGHDVKRIVIVTSPDLGDRLAAKIAQRAHYGYRVLKQFVYAAGDDDGARLAAEFREYLHASRVDDVILGLPASANDLAVQLVAECEDQGISIRIVPDLFPLIQSDTQIYDLDGIPLVNVRLYPTEYFAYFVGKRVFDFCLSLVILVLLSPLYLLIVILIRSTSPGPLFFSQERVGLNGRRFHMLKFRTMRESAALNPDSHWTIANDPNVTRLGRWLRRSNLDELPQFFNVLKGDMSIVGPRPERPFFLERFRHEVPEYMARHYVKSGITGWAQVNGWRGDTAIAERVAHDLYYIRNWGMKLDLKILLLTLTRTMFQRNV